MRPRRHTIGVGDEGAREQRSDPAAQQVCSHPQWPAAKARRKLAALERLGWSVKRQTGSHRTLARPDWPDFVFAFHDGDEIGPRMLARIAKHTGLRPEDL
jgi:predicted RNA binding protein YcfA (HicA-like mRNA interferase family)